MKSLSTAARSAALCLLVAAPLPLAAQDGSHSGIQRDQKPIEDWFKDPITVRNQTPQQGEPVATLRTFKIKKGTFDEFYQRSHDDVWPYFEKIGARVVGMWKVKNGVLGDTSEPDYDEVILMTRYASVEHWQATRDAIEMGGNGPDAKAMADAEVWRESVIIETSFKVLEGGAPVQAGPYYMPAVTE